MAIHYHSGQPSQSTQHALARQISNEGTGKQSAKIDKTGRRIIGTLWMVSIVAIGALLSPTEANAADQYELRASLKIDDQTVASPRDTISDGSESYVIVQGDEQSVRITYSVQSAGNNLLNARFLIEQDNGDGWRSLMQPAVQAEIGQTASVVYEAAADSDEPNVEFQYQFQRVD